MGDAPLAALAGVGGAAARVGSCTHPGAHPAHLRDVQEAAKGAAKRSAEALPDATPLRSDAPRREKLRQVPRGVGEDSAPSAQAKRDCI